MDRKPDVPVQEESLDDVPVSEGALPFDIRTLLIGLWTRRYVFLGICFVSGVTGIIVALMFGSQVWEASTVLVFKGEGADLKFAGLGSPTLETQRLMVATRSNLVETAQKLDLGPDLIANIDAFAGAVAVNVQPKTTLMSITVYWDQQYYPSRVANTLTEVFLESQKRLRQETAGKRVEVLQARLEEVRKELDAAEEDLQTFTDEEKKVDLEKEAEHYYGRWTGLVNQIETAKVGRLSAETQLEQLRILAEEAQKRAEAEAGDQATLENIREMKSRRDIVVEQMDEEKDKLLRQSTLAQKRRELEAARHLFEVGATSQNEYLAAEEAYKQAQIDAEEGPELDELRQERDKIDELAHAIGGAQSVELFAEFLTREVDLKLLLVQHEHEIEHLQKEQDKVLAQLYQLPSLRRKQMDITRRLEAREAELKALEEAVGQAKQEMDTQTADFDIITRAVPPIYPSVSKRKLMTIAVTAFGGFMALILVLGLEVLDPRLKSDADARIKLGLPVVGVFPKGIPVSALYPGEEGESEYLETFRIIARNVSRVIPKKGARVLITSTYHGEGRTFIATTLAMCFGRRDERVLLVDAQVRSREGGWEVRDLIPYKESWLKGLGEYLSYETDRIDEVIWPSRLAGVECLPSVREAVIPDLLATNRMDELLKDVSRRFSLVLLDGPPVFPYVDADLLAKWSDGILLVVSAQDARLAAVRKAIERLEQSHVPIVGVILNQVDPIYMDPSLYGTAEQASRLWPLNKMFPRLFDAFRGMRRARADAEAAGAEGALGTDEHGDSPYDQEE